MIYFDIVIWLWKVNCKLCTVNKLLQTETSDCIRSLSQGAVDSNLEPDRIAGLKHSIHSFDKCWTFNITSKYVFFNIWLWGGLCHELNPLPRQSRAGAKIVILQSEIITSDSKSTALLTTRFVLCLNTLSTHTYCN